MRLLEDVCKQSKTTRLRGSPVSNSTSGRRLIRGGGSAPSCSIFAESPASSLPTADTRIHAVKSIANLPPRVLIVDDNPTNLKLLRITLEAAGYRVAQAADGMQALALLAPGGISAVISDILMPGMDGYRLCREVRQNADLAGVPFILYSSSFTGAEDESLARDFGGDLFVRKPATAQMLEEALHQVLSHPAARHSVAPLPPERELLMRYNARLASKLEQKTRELAERNEQAAASEQQVMQAQKMEIVGQMTTGVAHDFNNIISVIMGFAEILLHELVPGSSQAEIAKTIFDASERAAALTSQLLLFSRKDAPAAKILDLGKIISELDPILSQLAGPGISIATCHSSNLASVRADSGQIEQVLLNLCVNARDAMPGGGKITISTANLTVNKEEAARLGSIPAGKFVRLSVADSGSGMTEEVRSRIFEPFFTTKPPGKGTGLGLATCEGIARQWGGAIAVESALGAGATFHLYLPVAVAAPKTGRAGSEADTAAGILESVLVVEDDIGLRELTACILKKQGFRVVAVPNGGEAVRLIDTLGGSFDLVLSDLKMPEMGGREMAAVLHVSHPGLRILFTSGQLDPRTAAEDSDRRIFIPKPYTPSALLRKVREVIDGPFIPATSGLN